MSSCGLNLFTLTSMPYGLYLVMLALSPSPPQTCHVEVSLAECVWPWPTCSFAARSIRASFHHIIFSRYPLGHPLEILRLLPRLLGTLYALTTQAFVLILQTPCKALFCFLIFLHEPCGLFAKRRRPT
ncbi:hypothetical protein EDD36DRAFT_424701 [Exophiala viscosa]|uniref:Uncharacterized protein n=1 Tax=Exophiala viscosa TaxID=2486360 RepID=A0AAN6E3V9_9EURO|nr:hypothetical protein EDD36DRAFT_424701 [Exophiala viscosa]